MRMRLGIGCLIALFLLAAPYAVGAESINSFDSVIRLTEEGYIAVNETIEYVFPEPRHGIYRYIPTQHPQPPSAWFRERYIDFELMSVTMDGVPVPYTVEEETDRIFIKIGDPDTEVSGIHRYSIGYRAHGALSYAPITELYWNVTGSDWTVPIQNVSATLIAPPGALANGRSCYQGLQMKSGSCKTVIEENGSITFSGHYLNPGEELTIAQSINPGSVTKITLERNRAVIIWGFIFAGWFGALSWFVYGYRTKNKTGNPIIAHYEPYPGAKPMYAGLLIDGRLDPRDITACVVYLAEHGYLKIRKIEKKILFFFEVDDYEIDLIKDLGDDIGTFERNVLLLFLREPLTVGKRVALSDLKSDLSKQRENHKLLTELRKDLEQDLEDSGFFQVTIPTHIVLGVGGALITLVLIAGNVLFELSANTMLFVIFGGLTLILLSLMYRRRTKKGYEALDHLKGFKEFLSITDADRFAFHNAPQKSPEQFMQYLPYAIAFGVEEQWTEVFRDISIPNPNWYDGGSVSSFSATNLSSSLGAFSTALAASSGASASSGGGSAGGGGGGGGGGSW